MKLSNVRLIPTKWDFVLAALIVLLALSLGIHLYTGNTDEGTLTAVITQDGKELSRIPLYALKTPVEITIGGTYTAVIQAENGRVCISESTCPNADCLHQGWITRAGQSIVCLPNHLVVTIEGGGRSDFDAITK